MMLQTCTRCRARRIKCDSLLPACANCARSDVECTFHDDALEEDIPRSYVKALNDRIQELRSQLALLPQENATDAGLRQGDSRGHAASGTTGSSMPCYVLLPGPRQDAYLNMSFPSRMTEVVFDVLAQGHGSTQPSSESSLLHGSLGRAAATAAAAADDRLAAPTDQLFAHVDNKAVVTPSAVRFLLARYSRCIRPQFDILPPYLFGHDGLSLKKMRNGTQKFQILMACAIAAARESYRAPSWKMLAQVCRDWAGELTTPIVSAADGDSLTATLLLLIYELADPSRGLMWELLDLAARTCLQLGWHRTLQSPTGGHGGLRRPATQSSGMDTEENLSPPEGLRLLAAINRIHADLQPIFHRPDLLSSFRLSAAPADTSDRYRKMYVELARAIYGCGPPLGPALYENDSYGGRGRADEGGSLARHAVSDNIAACPFVGEVGTYLRQLQQDRRAQGLDDSNTTNNNNPLIEQTWLLLLPVCARHKQCVHCFQEPDDRTAQGMRSLRLDVVQLATNQLDLVYRAATASDEFLPPILASARAFVAGCAIVVSILKQWTPQAMHVQDLIRCTEVLSLYAAHWDGGHSYLHVWRTIMGQL